MAKIEARDEGCLWIVSGETALGHDWLEENLQEDATRWAGGFAGLGTSGRSSPALFADGLEVSA